MADDANGYTADVQYEGQARAGAGAGAYGAPAYQGGAGGFQGGYQARKYIFMYNTIYYILRINFNNIDCIIKYYLNI